MRLYQKQEVTMIFEVDDEGKVEESKILDTKIFASIDGVNWVVIGNEHNEEIQDAVKRTINSMGGFGGLIGAPD